jgi:hypothetical protein
MMAEHAAFAISKTKFSFNAGCQKTGIQWNCVCVNKCQQNQSWQQEHWKEPQKYKSAML